MTPLPEIALQRLQKIKEIRQEGINPFAYRFDRTHTTTKVLAQFEKLAVGEHATEEVRVAGRLLTMRAHGKTAFAHLGDQDGKIQIYMRQDSLGEEKFKWVLHRLDLGDLIGVRGPVFRTKTGELTVQVMELTLLTKTVMPPPEKWHGLKDIELRYRQRYLDLMANTEVREVFKRRSRVMSGARSFLEGLGFLEVETPMLQPLAGGAAAKPFVTHHNALDMELFLRIAPELYLKRLLVGGFEKVFEVNRNFRNEGISIKHNPEFTMLEVYQAYADGAAMMTLTEELIAHVARGALGGTKVAYQGVEIELTGPYQRLGMLEAVRTIGRVDPASLNLSDADRLLAHLPPAKRRALSPARLLEELFTALVEPKLVQPVFITDYPIEISPLAKRKEGQPDIADRFELYIYGREIANGFSELNDPEDQQARFEEQLKARLKGDEEAHQMDSDFICALQHGMPPAGGMGLGMDRLVMLLTDSPSIRDVILFPLLKPASDGEAPALEEKA